MPLIGPGTAKLQYMLRFNGQHYETDSTHEKYLYPDSRYHTILMLPGALSFQIYFCVRKISRICDGTRNPHQTRAYKFTVGSGPDFAWNNSQSYKYATKAISIPLKPISFYPYPHSNMEGEITQGSTNSMLLNAFIKLQQDNVKAQQDVFKLGQDNIKLGQDIMKVYQEKYVLAQQLAAKTEELHAADRRIVELEAQLHADDISRSSTPEPPSLSALALE